MIDWRPIQKRLGVAADGFAGPYTYATLLAHVANRSLGQEGVNLGRGCAKHFPKYGIDTPLRLGHFVAQIAHESGGFRWMREIWGPTPAQRKYEGRLDLGNVNVGDGRRYAGRGCIQITGRSNYREVGHRLNLPLEDQPDLASDPETSIWIACDYWKWRGINLIADHDDITRVTKLVNGGTAGIEDRMRKLARAKEVLL